MSSKRYTAMKTYARAKKPKLDISVGRRPESPKRETDTGNSTQAPGGLCKNDIDVDFWDDDDDDVILLATQLAEAAEAVRKTDEKIITFTQFAPQSGTSTQAPAPPPSLAIKKNCLLSNSETIEFEAAMATGIATPGPKDPGTSNYSQKTTAEARRQLAQERQIKFLMERLDLMKNDNLKLRKELSDSNDLTEIKGGEVSLLRDELKHVRQQLQATKMEKLALAEQKAMEEAKHITTKEAVLHLKNARNTNQRLNLAKSAIDIKNYYKQEGRSLPRHFLAMRKLEIQDKSAREVLKFFDNYHIYRQDHFRSIEKSKKCMRTRVGALFETDFEQLLLNYAQLEKQSGHEYAHLGILSSVCKVFAEFWSYAHNLETLPNRQVYPYQSYPLTGGDLQSLHDLYQPLPLFPGERLIFLRRYVAILSLICSHNSAIAKALLQIKHGELSLLQIASDSIQILGFSHDLPEHFGLLEAFAAFLSSLLKSTLDAFSPEVVDPLFDLLKQLIFTRPSSWVFGQLSSCMLACSQNAAWPHLMAQMCVNSPRDCFISDRVRSIYRFGPDSCLLQVYAGLIELCFFSELPLAPSHFQLLLSTCRNHVDFVYQCFQNPPDFIVKMLPSLGDAEEDDDEVVDSAVNAVPSNTSTVIDSTAADSNSTSDQAEKSAATMEECSCECYVKLCLSVVTLVFQLMHQWILSEQKTDTEEVGKISQTAVHLLKLIFRENYLTCLFRDSEETTKHYLSLICSWWKEHERCLGFLGIHRRFLRQLELCHFMLKPLILEANVKNSELDLTEWNHITYTTEDTSTPPKIMDNMLNIDEFFIEINEMENYVFE